MATPEEREKLAHWLESYAIGVRAGRIAGGFSQQDTHVLEHAAVALREPVVQPDWRCPNCGWRWGAPPGDYEVRQSSEGPF